MARRFISIFITTLLSLTVLTGYSQMKTAQNLHDLVARNSKNVRVSFLKLDSNIDFSILTPIDTVSFKALSKFDAVNNSYCSGCPVYLYYHSYFEFNSEFMAAVFAKANYMEDGSADQLIIAFIDKKGTISNAFIAAEIGDIAECIYRKATTIKNQNLILTYKEDCAILDEKKEGLSSIDSTTSFYSLTDKGRLKLNNKTNIKIER